MVKQAENIVYIFGRKAYYKYKYNKIIFLTVI